MNYEKYRHIYKKKKKNIQYFTQGVVFVGNLN